MLCEGIEAAVVEVEAAPTWAPDGPQETQLDWRLTGGMSLDEAKRFVQQPHPIRPADATGQRSD